MDAFDTGMICRLERSMAEGAHLCLALFERVVLGCLGGSFGGFRPPSDTAPSHPAPPDAHTLCKKRAVGC